MSISKETVNGARNFKRCYELAGLAVKGKTAIAGGTAVGGTELMAEDTLTEVSSEIATEEGGNILFEVLSFFLE